MSHKASQASQHQDPADSESQLAAAKVEDAGSEGHAPNDSSAGQTPVEQEPEADQDQRTGIGLVAAAIDRHHVRLPARLADPDVMTIDSDGSGGQAAAAVANTGGGGRGRGTAAPDTAPVARDSRQTSRAPGLKRGPHSRSCSPVPSRKPRLAPAATVGQHLPAGRAAAVRLAEAAQQGPLIRQVFISHTGPQQHAAGSTFAASILKPALEAAGLSVFMDFSSLEPGCRWPQELVRAAANSAVVVVVLTKEYTQRYWCMLELSLALHSRSLAAKQHQQQVEQQLQLQGEQQQQQQPLVIPVFYDDPNQVDYSDHIMKHWQGPGLKHISAKHQEWVDASGWAANIRAMIKTLQAIKHDALKTVKDRDYQLARRVVAAAVKAMPVQLHLDEVFGLDQMVADLTAKLLDPHPNLLGLWLHGMGGSGKTTLAKLLFNRFAPSFQRSAFIQHERVANLQLTDLLKQLGATSFNESSPAGVLLAKVRDCVRDKAVLIVVDNVSVKGQLDDLLPRSFGQDSRVIITSRSSNMPDSQWWRQVNRHLLQHPMVGLAGEAAVQLLYSSANMDLHFQLESKEMCDAVKELLEACKGLPLALELTGAFLYSDDYNRPQPVAKWKDTLAALRQGMSDIDSEGGLKNILYSTFTTLELEQQHMFLDVATALRGQPKELALAVWGFWHGPLAGSFFEGLERRNLVSCDSKGQLQLHDVLEAVGRRMLLDQSSVLPQLLRGTRLWVQDGRLKGYFKVRQQVATVAAY